MSLSLSPDLQRVLRERTQYVETPEDECAFRNTWLRRVHGSLPSYALWREKDVRNETLSQRRAWWRCAVADASKKKV